MRHLSSFASVIPIIKKYIVTLLAAMKPETINKNVSKKYIKFLSSLLRTNAMKFHWLCTTWMIRNVVVVWNGIISFLTWLFTGNVFINEIYYPIYSEIWFKYYMSKGWKFLFIIFYIFFSVSNFYYFLVHRCVTTIYWWFKLIFLVKRKFFSS